MNFAGCDFRQRQGFLEYIYSHVKPAAGNEPFLLVFPAHLALLYAFHRGDLGAASDFGQAVSAFLELPPGWQDHYLELHSYIARRLQAYLVPGTVLKTEEGQIYHEAWLISDKGEVRGSQRQLFLSREERELGWSRGDTAASFSTALGKLGIIIGTDAWYPEVGRVLALQGTEILCHCGALAAGENKWRQLAGSWQQVQQNQFFCVESQLVAALPGRAWGAPSLIHAPCEMTAGFTGILAGDTETGAYTNYLEASLNKEARRAVIRNYPLLKLLNPAFCRYPDSLSAEEEHANKN